MTASPVMFVGGTGTVGRRALQWFRSRHPDRPVVVGGRSMTNAKDVAGQVGHGRGVAVDLARPGLGLSTGDDIAAMVMLAPDDGLRGLAFAQSRGVPYINIGNGLIDLGSEVAWFAHRPHANAVVLASHWLGGAAVALALKAVEGLGAVESIVVGALYDEQDVAGPLAMHDMQRLQQDAPSALTFREGARHWTAGNDGAQVTTIDGRTVVAEPYALLDVISLHAATAAPNIRFHLAAGVSSSRHRGGSAAAEITVEVTGTTTADNGGERVGRRSTLEFGAGQASLTGLCVVAALEVALGLTGQPASEPGLYFPELLLTPDRLLDQLAEAGAVVDHSVSATVDASV